MDKTVGARLVDFARSQRAREVLIGVLLLQFVLLRPAYAYVDPGSGSVIVTTILGLIAAVGYWFRKSFYRIRSWFGGGKDKHGVHGSDD